MAFPISQFGGGWFPSVPDTEPFIQGLSCPYLSPPSRARAQSVFVQMNWSLLLPKYAHCWVSSTEQRIFSTGQEFHRQRRKGHSAPQTFPEADGGVGGWAHSHLPHGPIAVRVRARWGATVFIITCRGGWAVRGEGLLGSRASPVIVTLPRPFAASLPPLQDHWLPCYLHLS